MDKFKKFLLWPLCALFLALPSVASEKNCNIFGVNGNSPVLCGVASQGGLVYGETSNQDVYFGSKKISQNGFFAYGLDRDAPGILKLKFCTSGTKDCKTYSYKIKKRKYNEQKVTVADKYNKYPDDIAARIDRENKDIVSVRAKSLNDNALYFTDFNLPNNLTGFKVSGVYGSCRVFNGVPKSPHKGVDFAAPTGTPVYPIANGTVILAVEHYMNGNIIMVSHGHGVVSAYLHLSKMNVAVGDKVNIDTKIGAVGSTGRSSGAHLHLGLYWGQVAIDPGLFIL